MPFDGTTLNRIDVVDMMIRVRDLLQNPNRWVRLNFKSMDRYCLLGAIAEVSHCPVTRIPSYLMAPLYKAIVAQDEYTAYTKNLGPREAIIFFNDTTVHPMLITALDEAIVNAQIAYG